ncbi:MAG TPA: type II toxin-antitoxin system VapC family toxin [Candidatus Sulfotelmatobacter sp.]|nr:type II toxin-antitoxin system VapC family toxin [Candidatus Sulfotelmatobacter sp.]
MKSGPKIYVLDANALLDYFLLTPGVGTIDRLLLEALRETARLMISVINLGEVFYLVWAGHGETKARSMLEDLQRLPIQVVPVDVSQTLQASELKVRHKLPYADSFAAALAIGWNATLVTSDRDFEKLGRRISVVWLPRS